MLVKAVLVFLLLMVGVGMVGRALTRRKDVPRIGTARPCRSCGRLVRTGERCPCGKA